MKHYIGCSGWSYDSWKGPFYPQDLDNRYWLPYYCIFKFVEIDSTFYRIPSKFMVLNWARRTPSDFTFAVKFPKVITHDRQQSLDNVIENLERFLEIIKPLQKKIVALLIQLPPWLEVMKGLNFLKNLEFQLDRTYRYAIEVRHHSWFNDLVFNYFKQNDFCLVWSQMDRLVTPPVITTDFVYLRLIGDRSIDEKDFGKIQKERMLEMQKWSKILKDVKDNEAILKTEIVSANNHYAGFGPMTARIFEEMIDPDMKKVSFPIYDYKISDAEGEYVDSYDNSTVNHSELHKEQLDRMKQSSISDFL